MCLRGSQNRNQPGWSHVCSQLYDHRLQLLCHNLQCESLSVLDNETRARQKSECGGCTGSVFLCVFEGFHRGVLELVLIALFYFYLYTSLVCEECPNIQLNVIYLVEVSTSRSLFEIAKNLLPENQFRVLTSGVLNTLLLNIHGVINVSGCKISNLEGGQNDLKLTLQALG